MSYSSNIIFNHEDTLQVLAEKLNRNRIEVERAIARIGKGKGVAVEPARQPTPASLPTRFVPAMLATYAAGTTYQLTATPAKLNFGTTDPVITIVTPGTYRISAKVNLYYNAATFAANRTVTLKIRRTNNTAADIANSSTQAVTAIITAITSTFQIVELPTLFYSTINSTDILEVWGSIDVIPTGGSIDAVEASITAEQIL